MATAHVVRQGRSRSPRGEDGGRFAGEDPIAKHVCHREVPHFKVVPGQLLGPKGRYVVRRLLGEGTFGRVLSCIDTVKRESVAVKIVKGVRRYCEFAEAEAEVLKQIASCDPGRQSRCVFLRDTFLHDRYHFCIVFERLGVCLHDFMAKHCQHGLLVETVRGVAQQLLQCLSFIHGLNLIHTDLKCRNVMFRNPRYDLVPLPRVKDAQTRKPRDPELVVIDFGGALFAAERGDGKVGTRHYRAPEVVVGLPWDEKVDCWSVGCMVALAYLGFRPIGADGDFEQLAQMQRLVGKEFPRPLARQALSKGSVPEGIVFNKAGRLEWPKRASDADAVKRVEELLPLREQICGHHSECLDLLEGLLQLDPKQRLSADAASDMPFSAGQTPLRE